MSVEWHKLGEFIQEFDTRNEECRNLEVLGLNKDKQFMPTVANLDGVDTSKYKVVSKGEFVFSGMQTGRDICIRIGLFNGEDDALVSPAYATFKLKPGSVITEEFLFVFFNRAESDRLGWFLSDSSVRANLDWPRFLDIEIPVPSIEEQEKVVEAWQGLRKMKEQNEQLAEPLLALCRSYLQDCKKKYEMVEIGQLIRLVDEVNSKDRELSVVGVNSQKEFMPTSANLEGVDRSKYKTMTRGRFVFSGMQTGRDICIRIALWDNPEDALVSPAYTTFELRNDVTISPDYFFAFFKRGEMDRLGWFYSDSSVRANLDWNRFCALKIPLPPLDVQQAIVDVYRCANDAKKIAAEADRLSREICPALIRHVVNED